MTNTQAQTLKPYLFVSNNKDSVQAERGSFEVKEDRTDSSSKTIRLHFVRFKSTNPNPGSPIVYLAGGPGGSGIGTAKGYRFDLFMKLREVADVIAFDQRGTGWSNPLQACFYAPPFKANEAIERADYLKYSLENIARCREVQVKRGHKLEAYNTTENARDLDELREVLGAEKISIWGISYGSHLAFEYIRLFENRIDKMVLASLEGPDHTVKLPKQTQTFLDTICARAAHNYGNEPIYPDLTEKIAEVHKRLKITPARATFTNRRGEEQEVAISNFELQLAITSFYVKNPQDSKKLPRLYTQLFEGDFSTIAEQVFILKQAAISRINPMTYAMDLSSGISEKRVQKVALQMENTTLGSTVNFLRYEWIQEAGFPQLPPTFRQLKPNKVPALLISGRLDGRTYVEPAKEIAQAFSNGQHVILDHAGHNPFMLSPKIGDMIRDFFLGKEINPTKIQLEPVPFE